MPMPPDCRGCGLPCPEFGWHRARIKGVFASDRQPNGVILALLDSTDRLLRDEVYVCATCATLAVLGLHPSIAVDLAHAHSVSSISWDVGA